MTRLPEVQGYWPFNRMSMYTLQLQDTVDWNLLVHVIKRDNLQLSQEGKRWYHNIQQIMHCMRDHKSRQLVTEHLWPEIQTPRNLKALTPSLLVLKRILRYCLDRSHLLAISIHLPFTAAAGMTMTCA